MSQEVREGTLFQGSAETITYTLTTTPWGSAPTGTSAKIYTHDTDGLTDVTATCMTGATSVAGDVITLPTIHTLRDGILYKVEIGFTCAPNTFEAYAYIEGTA